MKFSRSWLQEWVAPIPDNEEFFHQLTMAGLEVDGYEDIGEGLAGVVVAQIEEVTGVADSDHLNCCKVRTDTELLQVVCGAPNARVGLKTALAKTNSATGIFCPICFTQTLIRLNAIPLPIKYLIPFR